MEFPVSRFLLKLRYNGCAPLEIAHHIQTHIQTHTLSLTLLSRFSCRTQNTHRRDLREQQMPAAVVHPAWARYTKVRPIGSGASGHVFLATAADSALRDGIPAGEYALKRISISMSEDVLKTAATEVKILEQLEPHENIVRYYEHFFDDDNCVNIVMEYCGGGDLDSCLRSRAEQGQALTLCEIVFCAFQLIVAVKHLHAQGILHRDLKPANIFVCSTKEPGVAGGVDGRDSMRQCCLKVADFGIARVLERTSSVARTVVGTPFYIAPEQCNGEPYATAADMWALGCILYELASCGQRCFAGDNLLAVVRAISTGVVPPLKDASLQRAVMPMITPLLQLEAKKRFSAVDCLRAFFSPDDEDAEDGFDITAEFEDPDDVEI